MINFLLHIEVKPGCLAEAVEALTTIERAARSDAGVGAFVWSQHVDEPCRFTLFEQWNTEEDLQAHLRKDPSVWNRFVPCLAGEPQSHRLRPVQELALVPDKAEVQRFALDWFDKLNTRPPVEELVTMLATDGLRMVFPDATLTNEAEFRDWYEQVGKVFADQTHVLEQLEVSPVAGGRAVDASVQVVWRTRELVSGARLAFRARQSWRLERSVLTGQPVILGYEVIADRKSVV